MLGIERSAARCTWTAAVVLLLLWLVYQLRVTLFIFAVALLFAYLLSPLVDLLDAFGQPEPVLRPHGFERPQHHQIERALKNAGVSCRHPRGV